MLTHLIITRFNVRYVDSPPASAAWLDHRFPLFEQYCYPSLRGQTNQNFKWLVLFDAETPALYRDKIEQLQHWDHFRPVFLTEYALEPIINAIRAHIPAATTQLLTTTLDNDDALARGFVGRIQQEAKGQSFELLNVTNGFRFDVRRKKLYQLSLPTNPFISLVENVTEQQPISIISCLPHSQIAQRFPTVREIKTEPLWMQVVHGNNVAPTSTFGHLRVLRSHLASFALDNRWEDEASENNFSLKFDRLRGRMERILLNLLPTRLMHKLYLSRRH